MPANRTKPARTLWTLCLALLWLCPVAVGCSGARSAYYRAVREYQPAGSLLQVTQTAEANAVIKTARTLGFVAPPGCGQAAAGSKTAGTADCPLLMAELETAAIKRGYAVVSWRTIVTSATPVEAARALGADLVLRVRETKSQVQPATDLRPGKVRFLLRTAAASPRQVTLRVADEAALGSRCQPGFEQLAKQQLPARALILDALGATTGKPIWSATRRFANEESPSGRFYSEQSVRVLARSNWARSFGAGLIAVSAITYFAVWTRDSEEPFALGAARDAGTYSAIPGVAAAGLVGAAFAPRSLWSYPDPQPLLCSRGEARWLYGASAKASRAAIRGRQFARQAIERLQSAAHNSEAKR
jgi:hypothetical protein